VQFVKTWRADILEGRAGGANKPSPSQKPQTMVGEGFDRTSQLLGNLSA